MKKAQNALQREWGNFPFANWNGIFWGLPLQLIQLIKIHFLPHFESFMWERNFEKIFFKKSHIQTLMGYSLFSNSHFQMGFTVMGFAEHFGLCMINTMLFSYICIGIQKNNGQLFDSTQILWWMGASATSTPFANTNKMHML